MEPIDGTVVEAEVVVSTDCCDPSVGERRGPKESAGPGCSLECFDESIDRAATLLEIGGAE